MEEFFKESNAKLEWQTYKCLNKSDINQAFQELYLEAIRRMSSQTKSDNPDTIYGTSTSFMQNLKQTFINDIEDLNNKTQTMTGREINAYLFYLLEPKSLLDCFWLGHFVGAWTHHVFTNTGTFYKNGFHTNNND